MALYCDGSTVRRSFWTAQRIFYWSGPEDANDAEIHSTGFLLEQSGIAIGLGRSDAIVAAFVANGTWIYRASANARILAARARSSTPFWSVFWHAIPLANLWMPYRAIRQIWNRLFNPTGDPEAAGPVLLLFWSLTWILGNIVQSASVRLAWNPRIDDFLLANWIDLAGMVVAIFCAALFLKMLRHVTIAQRERETEGHFA